VDNKHAVLTRLREMNVQDRVGQLGKSSDREVLADFIDSGVKFAATPNSPLEDVYYSAVNKLMACVVRFGEDGEGPLVLQEGGVYLGCWLESTGTINAELLSRFVPSVAQATFRQFADGQREDGLMPYKVAAQGPVFRQIQLVTPLARSVWNHYLLNGKDREFLHTMYHALQRFDEWLRTYRDTRGTGCVEAFCTFDTGHDLSPRFWHVPDTPHEGDPTRYDPDSPILPFAAPDLTANVYCTRKYLGMMARELGQSGDEWDAGADEILHRLFEVCFDEKDGFFYDSDRHDRFVRVQSDVLLRVLACEVGDLAFFDAALRRYLLNMRKFYAKYPFTSIAMDDPRFDPSSSYNTWAGAVNFLSLIRTPHAFEHHGRHVELTGVMQPILSAMSRMTRFGQCLSPWTGEEGYTEMYSPAILCLLDYVERMCGILPTPEGELWFTGLLPYPMDHGSKVADSLAYSRTVDGHVFELLNTADESHVYRDGEQIYSFPSGTRLVTDRTGTLQAVVGMTVRRVNGVISCNGEAAYPIAIEGNEVLRFEGGELRSVSKPGVVLPTYE
jgi:hypothetical protein